MRRALVFRFASVALLALILGGASQAKADLISQAHPFSATFLPDQMLVAPFDPSLGTLDEVSVFIQGLMQFDFWGAPLKDINQNPIVYDFAVLVDQRFFGLGDQFFSFDSPAKFLFAGTDPGYGDPHSFFSPFTYHFTFNESTDLLGYTLPGITGAFTPPLTISGLRSDFLEPMIPINQIELAQEIFSISSPVEINSIALLSEGAMFIDYVYTPAPEPVPEPATMLLLGSGLIGLAGFRRKFRKR